VISSSNRRGRSRIAQSIHHPGQQIADPKCNGDRWTATRTSSGQRAVQAGAAQRIRPPSGLNQAAVSSATGMKLGRQISRVRDADSATSARSR